MKKLNKYVGLDVHKDTTVMAIAEGDRDGEVRLYGQFSSDLHALEKILRKIGGDGVTLHVVYEAGPTGFVLYRRMQQLKIDCIVVAPSKTPLPKGQRQKTDRRDAVMLARLHRAGELTAIHVPDAVDESIRDLTRARADAVHDLTRAKLRLKSFLLRQGYRYSGKANWSEAHRRYLREIVMPLPALKAVREEYLLAIDHAVERVKRLEELIESQVSEWRMYPAVHGDQKGSCCTFYLLKFWQVLAGGMIWFFPHSAGVFADVEARPHPQLSRQPCVRNVAGLFHSGGYGDFPWGRFGFVELRFVRQSGQQFVQGLLPAQRPDFPHTQAFPSPRRLGDGMIFSQGLLEFIAPQRPTATQRGIGLGFAGRTFSGLPVQVSGVAIPAGRRIGQPARFGQRGRKPEEFRALLGLTQVPVAGVTILRQLRHRHEVCPHRIQVQIMANLPQGFTFLHQECFIASLEQMAPFAPQFVKPVGKGGLQPLHPRDQISVRRFHRQMVVVAHHHECVQHPVRFRAGLEQARLKRRPGSLRLEYMHPVVAPIEHMVDRTGKLQP